MHIKHLINVFQKLSDLYGETVGALLYFSLNPASCFLKIREQTPPPHTHTHTHNNNDM